MIGQSAVGIGQGGASAKRVAGVRALLGGADFRRLVVARARHERRGFSSAAGRRFAAHALPLTAPRLPEEVPVVPEPRPERPNERPIAPEPQPEWPEEAPYEPEPAPEHPVEIPTERTHAPSSR